MKNERNRPSHVTTGDIFDDLGFSPEEALESKLKTEIWLAVIRRIEQKKYRQADLVKLLQAHQPDVSNLLKGKVATMSITRLLQFAARLGLKAQIRISASSSSEARKSVEPSFRRKRTAA
ncbi:transcriptional regulator, XRE family [Candidatus Koribacter versatilis Ellin345]|uniref:Transcriptional regulator, XRE family n=1 Tax=Koribacter versatilis (strain Ellin345) TaxID=204669 RepID=Q1II50_KORVE|nr:helix-turn-helix transcriptional regulator [Candidatus Koribacter versatilis]ABF43450.1 transcriptional regulator, XRE family [Candidatus Koribacter versatilis Ellin345]